MRETLRATRHTVKLGLRSNKAARDAVNVAQNIGVSQVQAYVAFTSAGVIEKTGEIALEGLVKNSGQSTARRVAINGRVDAFAPESGLHISYWPFDRQDLGAILPYGDIVVKMPVPKKFGPIPNEATICFAISITYENIFGHQLMEPLLIEFTYPNFEVVKVFNEKKG